MSGGNAAQTSALGRLPGVIIRSFMHSSFLTPSKNTFPHEIVISSLHSLEGPLSYLEVSLSGVSTGPVLLAHPGDLSALWVPVSRAMSVFVSFSIGSRRRIGCLFICRSYKGLDFVSYFPVMEVTFSGFKYPKGVTILQLRGLVAKASRKPS